MSTPYQEHIFLYFQENGIHKQILRASKLEDESCDSETEPYKFKYEARTIWQDVIGMIANGKNILPLSHDTYACVISAITYKLAVNYIQTDETQKGSEILLDILEKTKHLKCEIVGYSIYIAASNQLGFLYAEWGRHEDALELLVEVEKLYHDYKLSDNKSPICISEFFSNNPNPCNDELQTERMKDFEDNYTLTLYYLAQVYQNIDKKHEAAYFCHKTLKRQLDSKRYNATDWAFNAASLSIYFLNVPDFSMAKHCLASASYIFDEALSTTNEEGESSDHDDDLMDKKAYIDRCWIKYGLALMEESKEKLLHEVENMDNDTPHSSTNNDNQTADDSQCSLSVNHPQFCNSDPLSSSNILKYSFNNSMLFNLELTQYGDEISSKYLLDFTDAKDIFLKIQKWIASAQNFYTLTDHCTSYIELVQEHSRAYKLLSFFEPNLHHQCRMEKRRIDLLTVVLGLFNHEFYTEFALQIIFEIAEIYSSMMDSKIDILSSSNQHNDIHLLKKINYLSRSSIEYFERFLKKVKGLSGNAEELCNESNVRPALVAKFHLGRLYGKISTNDQREKIELLQQSFVHYKFIVDYCTKNVSSLKLMESELGVCNDMVKLLPLKLAKLQSEVENM